MQKRDRQSTITTTTLQLPSSSDYQENLDRLIESIETNRDSKIIIAPEVYLTAYDYPNLERAALFSAKAIEILREVISEQILAITMILKDGDEFVNRAIVIYNHQIVHSQNKVKLFKLGDEHRYLKAGSESEIVPFEVDGIKFALLICFELRFKELWRQIEGADIVLIPARWGLPRKRHLEILSSALAVMNQCFVLLSNSSDSDMASSSAIITPNGDITQDDSSEIIKNDIDMREIRKIRRYIVIK
ncbi:Aliphatic amidase AmiE [hydrothermal vent metagenome]|uniref:Aliphatic amidase AmiE n=1 Tax=hydrothermal vent metagenome TaxID=652676 RepID=A0A1W1C8G1_9ZZZZ